MKSSNPLSVLDYHFQKLKERYKAAETLRSTLNRLNATEFNLIKLFEPKHRENRVSDLIVELLKPDGMHGQGDVFIRNFLKILDEKMNGKNRDIGYWKNAVEINVDVSREYNTGNGRIDIFMEFDNGGGNSFAIGIENKVNAGEQEEQLKRYNDYLKSWKNYLLIYLTADGKEATTLDEKEKESLSTAGKYLEISYEDLLIPWLETTLKECEAEKVKIFVKDFMEWIKLLKKEDHMREIDRKVIEDYLLDKNVCEKERKERIEVAWMLRVLPDIFKKMREQVFQTLVKMLTNSKEFAQYEKHDEEFSKGVEDASFLLNKENWKVEGMPVLYFGIGFNNNDFKVVYYGISKNEKNYPFEGNWKNNNTTLQRELRNKLDKIFRSLPKLTANWDVDEWWVAYRYFDDPYKFEVGKEVEFYKKVSEDGYQQVAKYYFDKLVELKNATESLIDDFVCEYKKLNKMKC